ncbi:ATPase [Marinobacteraceae bacterium S3BR75-40.1]
MDIRTFGDLIEWTRRLHGHLSACLRHCSADQQEERARYLLTYLSDHEGELEKIVTDYEKQAPAQALKTYVYDFLKHTPIKPHEDCDKPFADLDYAAICRLIFEYHDQVIALYKELVGRAEIPETRELARSLLAMEEHEAMRLARQTARMDDL